MAWIIAGGLIPRPSSEALRTVIRRLAVAVLVPSVAEMVKGKAPSAKVEAMVILPETESMAKVPLPLPLAML